MKAIILSNGRGVQPNGHRALLPRPMLPIGDGSVLELLLPRLVQAGVREAVLTVGPLANLIRACFGSGDRYGLRLSYCVEEHPLGAAGCLAQVQGWSAPSSSSTATCSPRSISRPCCASTANPARWPRWPSTRARRPSTCRWCASTAASASPPTPRTPASPTWPSWASACSSPRCWATSSPASASTSPAWSSACWRPAAGRRLRLRRLLAGSLPPRRLCPGHQDFDSVRDQFKT